MAAEVFGGGVEYDVYAEGEGLEKGGGEQGVVYGDDGSGGVGAFDDGGHVEQVHGGVGDGFKVDEAGGVLQRRFQFAHVSHVYPHDFHAPFLAEVLVEEVGGVGVDAAVGDDAVAAPEQGEEGEADGGHPRGEGEGPVGGFEGGNGRFQSRHRWPPHCSGFTDVLDCAVVKRGVDALIDGNGRTVRVAAGVNGVGRKIVGIVGMCHGGEL